MKKTYWKTITPAEAAELLKLNTHNRAIRWDHVNRLAESMISGQWEPNGETIKFNCNRLSDGQHRLHACVKANVPFVTLVVEGLDDSVMDTIDTGLPRIVSDEFKLMGEAHATALSATLGLVDRYYTGRRPGHWVVYSIRDKKALLEKHPKIRRSVAFVVKQQWVRFTPPSCVCAAHYIFAQLGDEEAADNFIMRFMHGNDLPTGSPLFVLREKLMRELGTGVRGRDKQVYHLAYLIKAWNATRRAESIKVFRYSFEEPFPAAKP